MSTRRKRSSNRRRFSSPWLRLLTVLLSAATLGSVIAAGGIWGYRTAVRSRILPVRQITVTGCVETEHPAIIQLAGISTGISILAVDPVACCRRLEGAAWIRQARLRRQLPDRITIAVVMRRPVATMRVGTDYLVDTTGTLFAPATVSHRRHLPELTGLPATYIRQHPEKARTLVTGAVRALLQLQQNTQLRAVDISAVQMDPIFGISMTCDRTQLVVHLGHDPDDYKTNLLAGILKDLEHRQRTAKIINLRNRGNAFVRTAS